MKRVVIILFTMVLMLSLILTACAKGAQTPAPASTTAAPAPAATSSSPVASTTTSPKPSPTATPAQGTQKITWTLQAQLPAAATFAHFKPYVQQAWCDRGWADWITQATGGRLTVKIAEPNTIYPNADFVPNIGKGVIEAQFVNPSFAGGVIPEDNIFGGVPFAYTDWTQWYDWFYQFGGIEIAQAVNAEKNLLFIPEPDPVITQVVTSFPCPSVKDLKGRKIRSPANMTQFLQAVGATTVTMAYTDVYMGIKLGTVEGYSGGLQAIEDIKLKEVCKGAVVFPSTSAADNALFINMDAFNKLPDDIKGIIKNDTKYYMAAASVQAQVNYAVSLNRVVQEYPFTLWKWSTEDVDWTRQQCMDKIWPDLAKPNQRCAQIMDSIKAHLKSLGLTK